MPMDPSQYRITTAVGRDGLVRARAYHPDSEDPVGRLEAYTTPIHRLGFERMDSDAVAHYAYPPGGGQGRLFNVYKGDADMLAVHPDHQGEGLARAMANVLGHRVGDMEPSNSLTPDSAGMLSHLGVEHADPSQMAEDEDYGGHEGAAKEYRDQWAEQMLWNHSPTAAGSRERAERDETHLANVEPRWRSKADNAMSSPQFQGQIPGQQTLPGV